MDLNKLNQLLAQNKISQEVYDKAANRFGSAPANPGMDAAAFDEEDIVAERPADLGGQGRFVESLPDPLGEQVPEPNPPEMLSSGLKMGDVSLASATKEPEAAQTLASSVEVPPPAVQPAAQVPVQAPMNQTMDVITGRKETITSKEVEQSDASKQIQKDLDKAAEDDFEAKADLMRLSQEKQAIEFNENQAKQKIIADAAMKEQEIRDAGMKDFESRLQRLDEDTKALADREYAGYWANKSTGNKVLGAISLALGTFGSSLGGGPNTALNIINKAMDDDFRNYQDVTDNKIKAISNSRLNADIKKDLIQQQLTALDAKKLADIEVVNSRIGNLKNKFSKPELQAKLDELQASLNAKRLQERQKLEDKYAEEVNTQVTRDITQMQVNPATGQVVQEIDQALEIPGYGQARTKEEAVKLRERKTSTDEANAAAGRIRDIWTGKSKLNPLDRKDLAKLQTELGLIQGAMRLSLIGPGAVTDAEREFMSGLIGDPSKIFGLESIEKEKLETIINKMNVGLESEAKNVVVGYKGKPEAPGTDPTKKPVRKQYNQKLDKTKITYSDGSVEIIDGLK